MDPALATVPETAPASVDEVLKFLSFHGLLAEEEGRDLIARFPSDYRNNARALTEALVRQQRLTQYQANQILENRGQTLFLGNYFILEKLGQGGMGMVFKARHRGTNRIVALKVLPPALVQTPGALQRFHREAKVAARLNHPNIVAFHESVESDGSHFLVMEYVAGVDLSQLVRIEGPLPARKATDCILQAARGLQHAHEAGVIHRDIKPANLLLDANNTVKILDMGLARIETGANAPAAEEVTQLTQSGSIMGTCDFMAPEQALNTRKADHRADIYSLGCTLYYLMTGKPMYAGETSMEKLIGHRQDPIPPLPFVSKDVQAIYHRMVAKQLEDRYQSMAEVIADLEAYKGIAPTKPLIVHEPKSRPPDSERIEAEEKTKPAIEAEVPRPAAGPGDKTQPPAPPPRARTTVTVEEAPKVGQRSILMYLGIAVLAVVALIAVAFLWPGLARKPAANAGSGGDTRVTGESPAPPDKDPEPGRGANEEPRPQVVSLAFSRTGHTLVSATGTAGTKLWNVDRPTESSRLLNAEGVSCLAFSPDGLSVAGGRANGEVRIWDARTGEQRALLQSVRAPTMALMFSADGKTVTQAQLLNRRPLVQIWVLAAEQALAWPEVDRPDSLSVMALSSTGKMLACAGVDQRVRLLGVMSGLVLRTLEGHQAPLSALAFSADGSLLASADSEGRVRVWDTESGTQKGAFGAHPKGGISCLAFTPDGTRIVTGGGDASARLWDAATGRELGLFQGHRSGVTAVSISADGKLLVTGTRNMAVKVWEIPPLKR
jgi:serine/threonine protein kinase